MFQEPGFRLFSSKVKDVSSVLLRLSAMPYMQVLRYAPASVMVSVMDKFVQTSCIHTLFVHSLARLDRSADVFTLICDREKDMQIFSSLRSFG